MSIPIERARSPVAVLLDPKSAIASGERDIRLEDYINDKIQTKGDLGNLTTLLDNVELQKQQLEDQLKDAKTKLAEARKAAADHSSTIARKAQDFEEQQQILQRQTMAITSSDTPEEAVRRLKGPMEKLRKIEIAQAYVELLRDVDKMIEDAHTHLPQDPKAALKPYIRLRQLAISLPAARESAEGAADHLVVYVQQASTQLWAQMVHILTKEFEDILTTLKWPDLNTEPTRQWSDCFTRLLELQAPEINDAREALILLPLSVMVKPLEAAFRFHFMGNKSTSAATNLGEFFLEWFIGTINKYEPYLRDNVGPVLAAHFMGNQLAGNSIYVDPVSAFITALLPLAKEKSDALLEEIKDDPSSLSKFIGQLITWDDTIRNNFLYDAGNAEFGWKGLTWDVLDKWFDRWLQVEEGFAMQRYEEIMSPAENNLIDYDSNGFKMTKTTFAATKITDLLKSVTAHYQGLRRISHKVRFLLRAQINVLDRYQIRLADSIEAYMSLTSAVGRTFKGHTKEEQMAVEGMGGLVALCKVFCSADHIVSTLRELNNDDFFVQLYGELDERAETAEPESKIAGPETCSDVKVSTSLKLGTGKGAVFDTTIHSFQGVRDRAEDLLQQAIKYALPKAFRPYLTKAQWTTIGDEPLAMTYSSSVTISAELDQPLQTLKEYMEYLYKTVSYTTFMRIWRQVISSIEDLLWNEVLLKQDFTTLGAARFAQDIRGFQSVFGIYLPMGPGSLFTLLRLTQGIKLLNLPVEASEGELSLMEAAEKIFAKREDCEKVLEDLGLDHLTNAHARQIMTRRVEASD